MAHDTHQNPESFERLREEAHIRLLCLLEVYHSIVSNEVLTPDGKILTSTMFDRRSVPVEHMLRWEYSELRSFFTIDIPVPCDNDIADADLSIDGLYARRAPFLIFGIFLLKNGSSPLHGLILDGLNGAELRATAPRSGSAGSDLKDATSAEDWESLDGQLEVLRVVSEVLYVSLRGDSITPAGRLLIYAEDAGAVPVLHLLYRDKAFIESFFRSSNTPPEKAGMYGKGSLIARGILYMAEIGESRRELMRSLLLLRSSLEVVNYFMGRLDVVTDFINGNRGTGRKPISRITLLEACGALSINIRDDNDFMISGLPCLSRECVRYLPFEDEEPEKPLFALFPRRTSLPDRLPALPTSPS